MLIPILIGLLALVGFADSFYYTLVHYGITGFGSPLVPMICNPKQGVCEMLSRSSWASTFGLPNSLIGMGYYALVMLTAGVRIATGTWRFPKAMMAISLIAALFSIYLGWLMIFHIRALCPLCLAAQLINIVLAAILIVVLR